MAAMPEESSITDLLHRWSTGDPLALETLIPRVHGELHALADLYLQRETHEATAPTSLVHDLYLRLQEKKIDWENRHHFFGIAARILRQLLVARSRDRMALKRGAGISVASLEPGMDADALAMLHRRLQHHRRQGR